MKNTRHSYMNLIETLGKINKPGDNQQPKGLLIKFITALLIFCSCNQTVQDKITYPYSQWTVGITGKHITWEYENNLRLNASFIAKPENENWEEWYKSIVGYRDLVRKKIGQEEPFLHCIFPSENDISFHFDKFGYDLEIKPGEKINISGLVKNQDSDVKICFDFDLKTKGEELSYVLRKKLKSIDSIEIRQGNDWSIFSKEITVPSFAADSFSIVPIGRITCIDSKIESNVFLKDIRLSIAPTKKREYLLTKIQNYIKQQSEKTALKLPSDLTWSNQNFVMGFVYMWDQDFWNPIKGEYTVDAYCDKMEKEFGGFQSIILWHSYPNIGIDEKNQFDFFYQMPGGLDGLKKVVSDFHQRNIKVFITYNPWDLDTRRPELTDNKELAKIVDYCNVDGIFLDTWKSAAGSISIFSVENFIREEVAKYNRNIAFTSEILPDFKDLTGTNALTSSWGQEIEPFHYTDLSHQKWLMPEHKQYFIKRMERDRKPIMVHAWINGQGIQVWENIFGTMNLWNATDCQRLRKMNAIWKTYGNVYLSDNWKPFIPVSNSEVYASKWITDNVTIWNIADTSSTMKNIKIEVSKGKYYFDLWKGKEIQAKTEEGKTFVEIPVQHFSCLLETENKDEKLADLLLIQQKEDTKQIPPPEKDIHLKELSLKLPVKYPYQPNPNASFQTQGNKITGGKYTFTCKHIFREGGCYPDMNAKNNHDLVTSFEDDALRIIHKHTEQLSDYFIMSKAVTNGEFERFIKATNYRPRYPENFLKHWNGKDCPTEIKDKLVVYVSLEDARAFAEWAGMRLPTEWEWQQAAEQLGEKFIYNEVFEWNESERNDGYNRFVNLRGGCERWLLPSSWWYLPSAPYAQIAGGKQKIDSHVKYFLMYPGIDRASTIGFRCVK